MADTINSSVSHSKVITDKGLTTEIERYDDQNNVVSHEIFHYNDKHILDGKTIYDENGDIKLLDIYHYEDDGRLIGIDHIDKDGASQGTDVYSYSSDDSIDAIFHYDAERYLVSKDEYVNGELQNTEYYDREPRVVDVELYGDKSREPDRTRIEYWDKDGKIEFARERIFSDNRKQIGDIRMMRLENGLTVESRISTAQVDLRIYDDKNRISDEMIIKRDGAYFKTYQYSEDRVIARNIPCYIRGDRVILGNNGNTGFFDANFRLGAGMSPIKGISQHYAAKMHVMSEDIIKRYEDAEHEAKTIGEPYRPEDTPEKNFLDNGDISSVLEFDSNGNERQITHFNYENGELIKIEIFDLKSDDKFSSIVVGNDGKVESITEHDGDTETSYSPDKLNVQDLYPEYFNESKDIEIEYEEGKIEYTYDSEERIVEEIKYDSEDNISEKTEYSYDKEGNLIETETEYYIDGELDHRVNTEYTDEGESIYEYDSDGNRLSDSTNAEVIELQTDLLESDNKEQEDTTIQKDDSKSEENDISDNTESNRGNVNQFRSGGGDLTEYRTADGDTRADEWHSIDGKGFSFGVYDENDAYNEVSYDGDESKFTVSSYDTDGCIVREITIEAIEGTEYDIKGYDYIYSDSGEMIGKIEDEMIISESGVLSVVNPDTGETIEILFERETDNIGLDIMNQIESDIREEIDDIKVKLGITEDMISDIFTKESELDVDSELEMVSEVAEGRAEDLRTQYSEITEKIEELKAEMAAIEIKDDYSVQREYLVSKYDEAVKSYTDTGDIRYDEEAKGYIKEINELDIRAGYTHHYDESNFFNTELAELEDLRCSIETDISTINECLVDSDGENEIESDIVDVSGEGDLNDPTNYFDAEDDSKPFEW